MTLGFSCGSSGPASGVDFLRRAREAGSADGPGHRRAARVARWLALVMIATLLGLTGLIDQQPAVTDQAAVESIETVVRLAGATDQARLHDAAK